MAFGFVLILLLHFSLAVSKLSDQTKILAQRLALVEQQHAQTDRTAAAAAAELDEPQPKVERVPAVRERVTPR